MMYRYNETHFNTTDQENKTLIRLAAAFRTGPIQKGQTYSHFNWQCEGQTLCGNEKTMNLNMSAVRIPVTDCRCNFF